jgi:hypothetical protein
MKRAIKFEATLFVSALRHCEIKEISRSTPWVECRKKNRVDPVVSTTKYACG